MQKVVALIVTFNPSSVFFSNLKFFLNQFVYVVIVDNASDQSLKPLWKEISEIYNQSLTIIYNESNLGIATALNQGFAWGKSHGYDYVITFDQDSIPAPDMIQKMLVVYNTHPERKNIAIVAPNVKNAHGSISTLYLQPRNKFLFERIPCQKENINNVSLAITSGSLCNISAYQEIGVFREDFFIDYVDIEYCLRAKKLDYKIIVACEAILYHQLGNQQTKKIGTFILNPTFHSPIRWYYINRNRMVMYRLYAIMYPYWALYDFMSSCSLLLRMLLFEDQKLRKIFAFFLGIVDGIFGRMGQITAYREAQILGRK